LFRPVKLWSRFTDSIPLSSAEGKPLSKGALKKLEKEKLKKERAEKDALARKAQEESKAANTPVRPLLTFFC